jgi:adenine-specific DNA-methyltransferase
MELIYPNKKSKAEIIKQVKPAPLELKEGPANPLSSCLLIEGENLRVMKALLENYELKGKIDLVYIDPPFSTNTVFRTSAERSSHVSSSPGDEVAYSDKLNGAEFLEFIRERLILIRELMSDHGSIYLHIDYKIGHYLKIIMDEIFGPASFRNDIARIKCNPKNFQRRAFGNIKDLILFYTKSDQYTWNEPLELKSEEDTQRLFRKKDELGRFYTTTPLHAPGETINGNTGKMWKNMLPPKGRHWRYDPEVLEELDNQGLIEWSKNGVPRKIIYADSCVDKKMQDVWEFKDPQRPVYPTEKNFNLLKLIISTSSNLGDTVLDSFCGSGGTLLAADSLDRNWIGIDNSEIAIKTCLKRLKNRKITLLGALHQFSFLTIAESAKNPTPAQHLALPRL